MSKEDTRGEGINNTRLNRTIILTLLKLLGRWFPRQTRVVFLPHHICVKFGTSVRLTEARSMRYVAENTTIPVPHIYCAFVHHGVCYIVMKRLPGLALNNGWRCRETTSQSNILRQLRTFVEELRRLQRCPDDQSISAIDGGPILDERLPGLSKCLGPFQTVQEFHRHLRSNATSSLPLPEVQKLIALNEETSEDTCFTHGDLSCSNILVSGDQITGLVDWENAAWLPRYWEYVSAWHVNPQNSFWQKEVTGFLDVYPRELEMDKLRRKHFGDF